MGKLTINKIGAGITKTLVWTGVAGIVGLFVWNTVAVPIAKGIIESINNKTINKIQND